MDASERISDAASFRMRWGSSDDLEAAVATMTAAFEGDESMGDWVRMMMDGSHASAAASTVAVAEEINTGRIVSVITTCPQTWTYAGIPLKALNITEVGTHPEFRSLGLTGALMGMIHGTLEEQGYDFSLVWGVPYFYRKYGYVQTLANKASVTYARIGIRSRWDDQRTYTIRPMRPDDIPFGVELHLRASERNLVSFPYDARYWQMFVFDYFEANRDQFRVIEKDAERLGIFNHDTSCGEGSIGTWMFDLMPGVSWLDVTPWVIGYLLDYGDQQLAAQGQRVERVRVSLREGHPVYDILADCYGRSSQPEKNYYRITDMRGFLLRIAPKLEERIAESFLCGYSRELCLQLYGLPQAIAILFESGRITSVEWRVQSPGSYADVHMPLDAFYQLLFGQCDIDDIMRDNREVGSWNNGRGIDNEYRLLLKVLFPVMPSHINHCL